jgi:hypothetical protein
VTKVPFTSPAVDATCAVAVVLMRVSVVIAGVAVSMPAA